MPIPPTSCHAAVIRRTGGRGGLIPGAGCGSLRRSNESWLSENTAICGPIDAVRFRILGQIVRSGHFTEAGFCRMTSFTQHETPCPVVLVSQYPAGYPGFWCGVCAPAVAGFGESGTRRGCPAMRNSFLERGALGVSWPWGPLRARSVGTGPSELALAPIPNASRMTQRTAAGCLAADEAAQLSKQKYNFLFLLMLNLVSRGWPSSSVKSCRRYLTLVTCTAAPIHDCHEENWACHIEPQNNHIGPGPEFFFS